MRVLVCGGRKFADLELLYKTLDEIDSRKAILWIVTGAASGADFLAQQWARARGRCMKNFPAGPIRNQQMLDEWPPDLVVAFPGGRGTADMVRRAKGAGIQVMEIKEKRAEPKAPPSGEGRPPWED